MCLCLRLSLEDFIPAQQQQAKHSWIWPSQEASGLFSPFSSSQNYNSCPYKSPLPVAASNIMNILDDAAPNVSQESTCLPNALALQRPYASPVVQMSIWTSGTKRKSARFIKYVTKYNKIRTQCACCAQKDPSLMSLLRLMHAKRGPKTNTLFYILITPLLIVLVGIAIFAILYRNKGKALTANLQYWANDMCKQMKGTKDSPHGTFVNRSVASPAGLRLLGGTYLLDLDKYSFSEDACYSHGDILDRKASPDAIRCELGDNFPVLPPAAVSEDDQFRQIPTEDEYTDRTTQGSCYFPLLSRPESKPVSPFSEPLEVGENDSLSQCFTGTESLIDSANCCCSDPSCGMDPVHASSHRCLQNSFHQSACSSMGDADNQGIGVSLSVPKEIRCAACCVSCRESSSKAGNTMHSLKESGPSPLCTCCLDSPSVDQCGSASNNGVRSDPSDGNSTKDHHAKRAPESNSSTSDPPAASGNVTGNGNSTFISSGQVMNFKGEIIVVYVSQNSQEGSMSPGSSDDSLGSPVQEENLDRCETFAGNARQYKEKCAEMNSYHSVGDEPPSIVGEYKRTAGPIAQEETHESQNTKLFYNEASPPVQEEGKPGQFLKQPLN